MLFLWFYMCWMIGNWLQVDCMMSLWYLWGRVIRFNSNYQCYDDVQAMVVRLHIKSSKKFTGRTLKFVQSVRVLYSKTWILKFLFVVIDAMGIGRYTKKDWIYRFTTCKKECDAETLQSYWYIEEHVEGDGTHITDGWKR